MNEQHRAQLYTRRDWGKLALGALPAAALFARAGSAFAWQGRPDSLWGGVPFGVFAPYRFGPEASNLDGALKALVTLGVSYTELSNAVVERAAGAPQAPARGGGAGAGRAAQAPAGPQLEPAPLAIPCTNGVPDRSAVTVGRGGGGGRGGQTPEQMAAAEALMKWRTTVPMSRFTEIRRKFSDAGVHIYAYRLTLTNDMSDAEYDYTFNAARALGATQVTMEHPHDVPLAKRIGDAAAKHGLHAAYHLHTTASMTAWDDVMTASPGNGIQLDIGHYVAGTGESPVPFIEKHHARIFSMHLKDRKKLCHDRSENMPWGQGDTPIRDVLQTLKRNKWAIPAGIEFEYLVPPGSTWEAEIAKCVKYGKDALMA
jgi:sugar phosphate isomerase/epimerase